MPLICPRCKNESHCPCSNCKDRNAGKVLWVWDDAGELVSCGHCGFTQSADQWEDLAFIEYDKKRKQDALDSSNEPV